ncbi:(2Fe-2S)-binding protein [Georgenia sp. H159]|uniref:(2Fe-2S)-binding protein n=1 Tax=Georgenia sp. H159 TaxID=3076115 RepID=UPI002D778394|nr:(2Fe-2S)-binding protein [Georgenia sp. H159]
MTEYSSETDVDVTVNGSPVRRTVPARLTLADFLRDDLGLTGTHLGCEQGVCGACTVLVDGRTVRSCLMLAGQVDGCEVTTIEGLDDDPHAQRLRSSLSTHHGLQCGFCTPGIVVAACEMLGRCGRAPTHEEVRSTLSGNLCRCTGYTGIVDAVVEAGQSADR